MYLNSANQAAADAAGGAAVTKHALIYEVVNKRWEVAFALSDGQFQNVSFANSIATTKGGTHVEMIATMLANKLYVPSGSVHLSVLASSRSRRRTKLHR